MATPSYIFYPIHPVSECTADRFLAAGDQHGSAVWPSIWPVPLTSPPCLSASKVTDFRMTGSLGCWS